MAWVIPFHQSVVTTQLTALEWRVGGGQGLGQSREKKFVEKNILWWCRHATTIGSYWKLNASGRHWFCFSHFKRLYMSLLPLHWYFCLENSLDVCEILGSQGEAVLYYFLLVNFLQLVRYSLQMYNLPLVTSLPFLQPSFLILPTGF